MPAARRVDLLRELVGDREDRRAHALVLGRQEAHQRDQEQGGVQCLCLVVLDEDAAVVDAALADVIVDLVGDAPPEVRTLPVAARLRQPHAAVDRDPAHHLRRREVLGLPAHLPDPAVRLGPVRDRVLDVPGDDVPARLRELLGDPVVARVQRERVEQHPPDVVLTVVVGAVADPDGPGAVVARKVVERLLGEVLLPADSVHDLEAVRADRLGQEREVLVCLPVEAQVEQPREEEGRVADPGEAVVPVALPARRFGQRGSAGRHHRARGSVAEALERQGAPLEVAAPGMVGERSPLQPAPPVLRGGRRLLVGLLERLGRPTAPRERGVDALALAERGSRVRAGAGEPESGVGGEDEVLLQRVRSHARTPVAVAVIAPGSGRAAVVEQRQAVEDRHRLSVDAGRDPQEHLPGDEVTRRAAMVRRALISFPVADHEAVMYDHPAGRRPPGRLEHHASREVAALGRDGRAVGQEPEHARAAVEQCAEDAGGVGTRQAEPLDLTTRRDERTGLAVGEEPVVGDRREPVHRYRCHAQTSSNARRGRAVWARRSIRSRGSFSRTTTAAVIAHPAAARKPIPSASVNAALAASATLAPWSAGRLDATACAWPTDSSAARRAESGSDSTEDETREAYSELISEPTTAVPRAPATWRVTSFIADATPDFSSGTAPITELVAGPMIQPRSGASMIA